MTEGYPLKPGQIVIDDIIVQTYPDNDGNMWYYHPVTGEKITIEG